MWLILFSFVLWNITDWCTSEPEGLPAGRRHADQNHSGPGAASVQLQAAEEGS